MLLPLEHRIASSQPGCGAEEGKVKKQQPRNKGEHNRNKIQLVSPRLATFSKTKVKYGMRQKRKCHQNSKTLYITSTTISNSLRPREHPTVAVFSKRLTDLVFGSDPILSGPNTNDLACAADSASLFFVRRQTVTLHY